MKKAILKIMVLATLVLASCGTDTQDVGEKKISGNLLLVIGFEDDERLNEFSEIRAEIFSESMERSIRAKAEKMGESMTSIISNLALNEEVEIRLSAYDDSNEEVVSASQNIVLRSSEQTIVEFIFE